MAEVLRLFIPGSPAPGGSKTAYALRRRDGSLVLRDGGQPVINMVDAGGKANAEWKRVVAITARSKYRGEPVSEPVDLMLKFCLRRPKSHYGTGKNEAVLKADAPKVPAVMPDLTKLVRSTEDALKGIVWVDDGLVCDQQNQKRYCKPNEKTGVWIIIHTITDDALSLFEAPSPEAKPVARTQPLVHPALLLSPVPDVPREVCRCGHFKESHFNGGDCEKCRCVKFELRSRPVRAGTFDGRPLEQPATEVLKDFDGLPIRSIP